MTDIAGAAGGTCGTDFTCLNCAERVSTTAITCRLCGYGLSNEHFIECKFCKERIHKEAMQCRHCRSVLDQVELRLVRREFDSISKSESLSLLASAGPWWIYAVTYTHFAHKKPDIGQHQDLAGVLC
jgi:ribosomal protein L40E